MPKPNAKTLVRRLRAAAHDEAGAAALEFSAIAPVLALIFVSAVDLGRGVYRDMQVQNAAQAGAGYAIAHGFDTSSIVNAVAGATSFSGITASPAPSQFCGCASTTGIVVATCNSTCPGGSSPGSYVTVSAQGTYVTLLSYPGIPKSFSFSARATARLQ